MDRSELASMLKGVAQVHDYFGVDEDKLNAWSVALDQNIDYGWAMRWLGGWLGNEAKPPLPVDVNQAWKVNVRERNQQALSSSASSSDVPKVGMPDWFKKAMTESFGHADLGNMGKVKKSGKEIQEIFDRHTPIVVEATPRGLDPKMLERHCGKAGCRCMHLDCYKGWVDQDVENYTSPCTVCRESLAAVLATLPPLGLRSDADHAKMRNHAKSDYQKEAI